MRWGLLGAIGGIGMSAYYLFKGNTTLFVIYLLVGICIPLIEPLYLYQSKLNGEKKFDKIMQYITLSRLLQSIVIIGVVLITKDILLIIVTYLATMVGTRLYFFLKTRHIPTQADENDTTRTKKTLHYGKHLSFIQAISLLSVYIDKVLIYFLISPAALAGYFLALVPYKQTRNLLSTVNSIAFPKFSNQTDENIRKTLFPKVMKMFLISIPITCVYIVLAPPFFQFFYPDYTNAVLISQVIFLQILLYPFTVLSTLFQAKAHKKNLYILTLSYAIIRIILLVVLIPIYNVWGAVLTILISRIFESIVSTILFFYTYKKA